MKQMVALQIIELDLMIIFLAYHYAVESGSYILCEEKRQLVGPDIGGMGLWVICRFNAV